MLPSVAVQGRLRYEMLAERVGQDFRIEIDPMTTIVTVLIAANSFGGETTVDADSTRVGSGFSLVFRGPVEPLLPQRTYRVVHDELAEMDIFIVPIGRDDAGTRYEAIFS